MEGGRRAAAALLLLAVAELTTATQLGVVAGTAVSATLHLADGRLAALLAVGVIGVGAAGCLWGGWVADRLGRARRVTWAMAASGSCALLIGLAFGRTWWLLAPLALAWGCFVVADSAQSSVLVTERVPPHAVGTALTLQLPLGFLPTTLTIQAVPWLAARHGWGWAFAVLAIGPFAGIASIARLRAAPG